MEFDRFKKLINPNLYQVFLFYCPISLPGVVFIHPWFVINKKGIISRYEVRHKTNMGPQSWGYLYKDFFEDPTHGVETFIFSNKYFWQGKLMSFIEGQEKSDAKTLIDLIETSPNNYPHLNSYGWLGPNSNTYIQYLLNQIPNSKLKLPFSAVGKKYSTKN